MNNSITWAAALVMVISSLSQPLAARERRGSIMEVTLSDGRMVKGELLAVKGHELIIHDPFSSRGFIVSIDEVSTIKIKKKPGVLTGFAAGLVAGVVAGCALYAMNKGGCPDCDLSGLFILITPCITTPIGTLTGALLSVPKILATKGEAPAHIEECLRYLQKHARN